MLHAFDDPFAEHLVEFVGKLLNKFSVWHHLLIQFEQKTARRIALLAERLIVMMTLYVEIAICGDRLNVWQRFDAIQHIIEAQRLRHNLITKILFVEHQHLVQVDDIFACPAIRFSQHSQLFGENALGNFRRKENLAVFVIGKFHLKNKRKSEKMRTTNKTK